MNHALRESVKSRNSCLKPRHYSALLLGLLLNIAMIEGCGESKFGSSPGTQKTPTSADSNGMQKEPLQGKDQTSSAGKEANLNPENIEKTIWEGCCPEEWNTGARSFTIFAIIEFQFKLKSGSDYIATKKALSFHSDPRCQQPSLILNRPRDRAGSLRKMASDNKGQSAKAEHAISAGNIVQWFPVTYQILNKTSLVENIISELQYDSNPSSRRQNVEWKCTYKKKS
jgi:hypothetical protein